MKLVFHLVKKDLHRLWSILTVFVLLIAAKLGCGAVLLHLGSAFGSERFDQLQFCLNFAATLEAVVGYLFVAALVHEDAVVGTNAFWMTRPISGLRLLAAKSCVLLLVFVILPLLVTLPWWLAADLDLVRISYAARDTVQVHAIVVLLALPIAVLTRTSVQYLVWSVLALATTMVAMMWQVSAHVGAGAHLPPALKATRFLVVIALGLCGILGTVVHQYRTRYSARTIAVAASFAAAFVAALLWWPWTWRSAAATPADASPLNHEVTVTLAGSTVRPAIEQHPGSRIEITHVDLSFRLQSDTLPERQVVNPEAVTATWTWPTGEKLTRGPLLLSTSPRRRIDVTGAKTARLTANWNDGLESPHEFVTGLALPRSFLPRLKEKPSLEVLVDLTLAEQQNGGTASLADGRAGLPGRGGFAIDEVRFDEGRIHASLTEWFPASSIDGYSKPGSSIAWRLLRDRNETFQLLDSTGRPLFSTESSPDAALRPVRVAGVGIVHRQLSFTLPREWLRDHEEALKADTYLSDLAIARKMRVPRAHFQRKISADSFEPTFAVSLDPAAD